MLDLEHHAPAARSTAQRTPRALAVGSRPISDVVPRCGVAHDSVTCWLAHPETSPTSLDAGLPSLVAELHEYLELPASKFDNDRGGLIPTAARFDDTDGRHDNLVRSTFGTGSPSPTHCILTDGYRDVQREAQRYRIDHRLWLRLVGADYDDLVLHA